MKKLLLLLMIAPVLGYGQQNYQTEGNTYTIGSTGEFKNNHTYIDIIPYSSYEREMNKRKQNKQIDNSDF